MKKNLYQKSELIRLIQIFLRNELVGSSANQGVERYFHSFLLLVRSEDKKVIYAFLLACIPLFQKKRIPFFRLNTFIKLYEKWKIYPDLIKDLQKVANGMKKAYISENLCEMLIRISGNDKSVLACRETRLMLLTCMINNHILDEGDLNANYPLLQAILSTRVPKEDLPLLKKSLVGSENKPYWAVFHHILKMKKGGATSLEISEMINIHFGLMIRHVTYTQHYADFIEQLYQKLPPNFMAELYFHEVDKLYFIYTNNPNLFEKWLPETEKKLELYTLITSLFKSYIISGIFPRQLCSRNISEQEKEWFAYVLRGNHLMTAENLPIRLTRSAAHRFRCLDDENYTVTQGILFSGIDSLVNDVSFSRQVVNSIRDITQAEFWIKTMSLLHRNGLPSRHVNEVMDYIAHKVFVEGIPLDLKRKKISNLLVDVHAWHQQVNEIKIRSTIKKNLPNSGVEDYLLEFEGETFEISQIRKEIDLYKEGQNLSHCVYTYKGSCYNGRCYIFSLRILENEEQKKPLITLELRNKQVVQARGKFNRVPNETEAHVIQLWAKEMGFSYVA
jgi:hypothetical protein